MQKWKKKKERKKENEVRLRDFIRIVVTRRQVYYRGPFLSLTLVTPQSSLSPSRSSVSASKHYVGPPLLRITVLYRGFERQPRARPLEPHTWSTILATVPGFPDLDTRPRDWSEILVLSRGTWRISNDLIILLFSASPGKRTLKSK